MIAVRFAHVMAAIIMLLAACSSPRSGTSDIPSAETDSTVSEPSTHGAAVVAACRREQLLGYVPSKEELESHRMGSLPVISYPFGSRRDDDWGMQLTIRIDEAGQVVCYSPKDQFDRDQPINAERRAVFSELRYMPFLRDGRPVAAVFSVPIREQELPEKHLPMPQVPLSQVHIVLERTGCFGTCPSYKIDLHGDGQVVYVGRGYVDVEGKHAYRVPTEDVAKLVESLRTKDLWSMRPAYRAHITDNPTYVVTIDLGGNVHRIEDYVGEAAGMPAVVTEFENEVDKVARSGMWLNLTREGVEHLEAEGFPFASQGGADLLARAVANDDANDDEAMVRLFELVGPALARSVSLKPDFRANRRSLIEDALRNHRALLVDSLIESGILNTNGKPDQNKIDAAFRAAIVGGRLALVQKIWEVSGDKPHPALTYEDASDDDKATRKQSPVTLLLSHYSYQKDGWEGLEIAKWLVGQGCDVRAAGANGETLLHIAAEAGDADLVSYLIDQGLDASTPGEYGLPALGSAQDEAVAMILLEAGTDLSRINESGFDFRRYAEEQHWQRVVEWLVAHGRG